MPGPAQQHRIEDASLSKTFSACRHPAPRRPLTEPLPSPTRLNKGAVRTQTGQANPPPSTPTTKKSESSGSCATASSARSCHSLDTSSNGGGPCRRRRPAAQPAPQALAPLHWQYGYRRNWPAAPCLSTRALRRGLITGWLGHIPSCGPGLCRSGLEYPGLP